jgi:hypothetical protein
MCAQLGKTRRKPLSRTSKARKTNGTLTAVTVRLDPTFPTTQTVNKPLPRRYDITGDGTGFTATLAVCYDDFDLTAAGVITESALQLYRYAGNGYWQPFASTVNTVTNLITATGIISFSTWAIGVPETNAPTVVTLRTQTQRVSETLWVYAALGIITLGAGAWWASQRRRCERTRRTG